MAWRSTPKVDPKQSCLRQYGCQGLLHQPCLQSKMDELKMNALAQPIGLLLQGSPD